MSNVQIADPHEGSMAHSCLGERMTAPATSGLFVRRLPPGRGFLAAAGLEPTRVVRTVMSRGRRIGRPRTPDRSRAARSAADTIAATGVPQRSGP